jgi:hypothetical protein
MRERGIERTEAGLVAVEEVVPDVRLTVLEIAGATFFSLGDVTFRLVTLADTTGGDCVFSRSDRAGS